MGFPHSSIGKESACNAGDLGLTPGLGRSHMLCSMAKKKEKITFIPYV